MALRFAHALPAAVDELRYEPRPQRIRVGLDGRPVADTTDAYLVWEPRRVVPMYAIPRQDFDASVERVGSAVVADLPELPRVLGPEHFDMHTTAGHEVVVTAGDRTLRGSAYQPTDPDLGGRILLDFGSFTWQEEEDTVIGHPHDPFKRIDVLASSRRVTVSVDGVVLADSTRALMLLETLLPVRWYFPRSDVHLELLTRSGADTICAYKGHASYFSYEAAGRAGSNLAWTYVDPLHDALRVKDHVAFFDERVDTTVDGQLGQRPRTQWSEPW